MKKQNIMPVAVLTVICLVVALILGAVNLLTAPIIKEREEQKKYDSLREVLDGTFTETEIPESAARTVTAMYEVKDGDTLKGHVVTLEVNGYAGVISMTVGVKSDGTVTKVVITNQSETHGRKEMKDYPDKFSGVSAGNVASVELVGDATISSTAIRGGVIDAVNAVVTGAVSEPAEGGETTGTKPAELPKTEDELKELMAELVADAEGFEKAEIWNAPKTLKSLYSVKGKGGYIAYIVTEGEYVPVANEGLIYINADGDIEKINHLTWIVGNEISADGFAEKFIGRDNWNADEVELITQATYTSGDFRGAVVDALDVVTKMLPRTEKKILDQVKKLVPNAYGFEAVTLPEDAPESLNRLYRAKGGFGYVAYIVTPGDYVAVATETLVHYDTEGRIVRAENLVWNVGHGIPAGNFADRFAGATKDSIDKVELVTAATGTSLSMRQAIAESFDYIPREFPTARLIGFILLALAVGAASAAVTITRKRRAVK